MKKNLIRDLIYIILGNIILCFAVAYFIVPSNILTGGVAGIAIIIKYFVKLDTTTIINILVIGLFILGFLALGKKFAMTTILSTIIYPVFLTLFTNYLDIPQIEPLYASIYGGIIAGVGVGLVMRTGSSTGGMDIPPLVIHKYTDIPISKLVFVTDFITVTCGLFIYGLEAVLIGLFSVAATSYAISKILTYGGENFKSVQIISDNYQMINKRLNEVLDRGSTIFKATGGFTNQDKVVLLVVIDYQQYNKLLDIVNELDSKAFVIVSDVSKVHGEGFTYATRV